MKKSFVVFLLGLFLIIIGIIIQFESSSIVRFILDENFSSVSIDRFYLGNFSMISIGSNLFLIGCLIVLIEYVFLKLHNFRN